MNIFFLPLIFAFINEGTRYIFHNLEGHFITIRIISGVCHDDHRGPGSRGLYQVGTEFYTTYH